MPPRSSVFLRPTFAPTPRYSFMWDHERREYDILENGKEIGATAKTDVTACAICQAMNESRGKLANTKLLILSQTYSPYAN